MDEPRNEEVKATMDDLERRVKALEDRVFKWDKPRLEFYPREFGPGFDDED